MRLNGRWVLADIYEDDPELENEGVNALRKGVRARGERVARSGLVTALGLILLLAILSIVWWAHVHGRIHQLTTTQAPESTGAASVRPGGQDIIRLERLERMGLIAPEFTAATLLPGDGMLMLQASLDLPGSGEIPLLRGTREADLQTGGQIHGAVFSVLMEHREGNRWVSPVELIAGKGSDRQTSEVVPDGSRATAHFAPAGTQSGVDTTIQAALTGRALDLTVTAKNTGNAPRALTIVWLPRFWAAHGLQTFVLQPPSLENGHGGPAAESIALGARTMDQTYTPLKHSYLGGGPQVRLRNTADGYTLVMTAMTSSIRSLHVNASQEDHSVLLAFSTASGERAEDARTIVQPGETLQWRVRVEAIANATYSPPAQ